MSVGIGNLVKENIDAICENFEKFITTKTVVGEPVTIGDTIIVPFVTATFGFGTGGEDGGAKEIGGGGGARMTPEAILILKGDEVQLLHIKKGSSFEKLIDMVPDIVTKFHGSKDGNDIEE